ncbi:hypothetical protein H0H87_008015 [Tephrocybe sp. NHM501043]|nr:hypothetical protein H0H87_008015 [Tephrocybe sp. NHM501043]
MDNFLNNVLRSFAPMAAENDNNSDMPPLEPISGAAASSTSSAAAQDITMGEGHDMPEPHSVSALSADSESDEEEANEVLMQAVDDDNGSTWTDESASMGVPALEPIQRSNRRARVDEDEDEGRDRRHPSERISNPLNNVATTLPWPFPVNPAPTPPAAHPLQADAAPEGEGAPVNAAQPPAPDNGPRRPFINGFAITIDINGQRVVRPLQGGAGGAPFNGAGLGFPHFLDLLSSLSERETEDPERAKQLVNGLEEVPVGLIRRMEALNEKNPDENSTGAGDCSCAICWDRLLDGEGGFGAELNAELAQEVAQPTAGPSSDAPMDVEGAPTVSESSAAPPPDTPAVDTPTTDESSADSPMRSSFDPSQPKIVTLPCAHIFHASCLIPWFSRPRQTTCPTCRFNIDPEHLTARRRPPMAMPMPQGAGAGPPPDVAQQRLRELGDQMREAARLRAGGAGLNFAAPPTAPADGGVEGNDVNVNQPHANPIQAPPVHPNPPAPGQGQDHNHGAHPTFLTIGFDIIIGPPPGLSGLPSPAPNANANPNPTANGDNATSGRNRGPTLYTNLENTEEQLTNDNIHVDDLFSAADQAAFEAEVALQEHEQDQDEDGEFEDFFGVPGFPAAPFPLPDDEAGHHPFPQWEPEVMTGTGRTMNEAFTALLERAAGAPGQQQNVGTQASPNGAPPETAQTQAQGQGQGQAPAGQQQPHEHVAQDAMNSPSFQGFLQTLFTTVLAQQQQQQQQAAQNHAHHQNQNQNQNPNPNPAAAADHPPPQAQASPAEQHQPGSQPGSQPQPQEPQPQRNPNPFLPANLPPDHPLLNIFNSLHNANTNANANANPAPAGQNPSPLATGRPRIGMPFGPFTTLMTGGFTIPGGAPALGAGGPANANAQTQVPPQIPGFTRFGPFPAPNGPQPQGEKKAWTLPAAPGPTLRQRVERREREAGLRCYDVSCGLGPSDEDPFAALTDVTNRQLNIRAPKGGDDNSNGDENGEHGHDTVEGKSVCSHTFHPACLVSAARLALMGQDAVVIDGGVEVACSVCRGVGNVAKGDWDEGVKALA